MIVLHIQKVAGISGSEAHLLRLLPALRSRGWDVRFLMLHENEPGAWQFAAELEAGGVPLAAIELRRDVDARAFGGVLAHLASQRPSILHTHLVHGDAYGLGAGTLLGVPIRFSTKHGFNAFRAGRGFALADRTLGRLADRQIAISRGLARYLADTEGFEESDFEVIHYGIAAAPAPARYGGASPRFLCVGRLIPIKGHAVLLRAFRTVLDRRPDAQLAIAGQGVLEPALRALGEELELGQSVSFLGHVSPVAQTIEQAFALVVPSLGEGFGMVALEAMERARPVIASSIGGLGDLVRDGENGLLVPPGADAPLAAAMLALADDPAAAAAMGLAGRVRALARFTELRCTERTVAVYRDWIERRSLDQGARASAAAASSESRKSQLMR